MEGGDIGQQSEYIDESTRNIEVAEELNKLFEIPEDCTNTVEVWKKAIDEGILPSNFENLEAAVESLKNAISDDILYNGPTETIHDNNVIKHRADFIGKIGKKLIDYIELHETPNDIPAKLNKEMTAIVNAISEALNPETKFALEAFIRLHFHCFKNCYKTDCLNID